MVPPIPDSTLFVSDQTSPTVVITFPIDFQVLGTIKEERNPMLLHSTFNFIWSNKLFLQIYTVHKWLFFCTFVKDYFRLIRCLTRVTRTPSIYWLASGSSLYQAQTCFYPILTLWQFNTRRLVSLWSRYQNTQIQLIISSLETNQRWYFSIKLKTCESLDYKIANSSEYSQVCVSRCISVSWNVFTKWQRAYDVVSRFKIHHSWKIILSKISDFLIILIILIFWVLYFWMLLH